MGKSARERVIKKFNWKDNVNEMIKIYNSSVNLWNLKLLFSFKYSFFHVKKMNMLIKTTLIHILFSLQEDGGIMIYVLLIPMMGQ